MVRRRWPDIVIVAGIVALVVGGIWVLWGQDIKDAVHPPAPDVEQVQHGGGVT